jgi:hypothetical protein
MLKGVEETVNLYTKQDPLSAAEKVNFSPLQDTLRSTEKQISNKQIEIQGVSNNIITISRPSANYSIQQLDSINTIAERREKQIQLSYIPPKAAPDSIKLATDTLSVKYSSYNFPFTEPQTVGINNNFLSTIPVLKTAVPGTVKKLQTVDHNSRIAVIPKKIVGFEGKLRQEANLDWFTVAIIVSLFVFSWMKVVYQKFVVQIITGLVDYQVAMRLYREKNVLFRNVSVGLHTIFYINMGLYIYYLIDFKDYPQVFKNVFLSVFIYSLFILLIYNIKSFTSKILGYLFLVQENFAQYIHNVNLYNKNIGLFLFPIVIIYPFAIDEMKPIVIYAGLILMLGLFLLRSYRSAQIIMKKGISLFYLILYLCAVELLPVLLLVKFASTLV